jgi:hypothetical protein
LSRFGNAILSRRFAWKERKSLKIIEVHGFS